ncbi:MAG: potassium channel family protein [Candidatus Micrarchaeia archaeon]
MASNKAKYELLGFAALLFAIAVLLTISAGVTPYTALFQNAFGSLEIDYTLLNFNIAENPLILISAFINTVVFAIITVVFASIFFSTITKINLRERRVLAKVKRLNHHIIIAPYNQFALEVANEIRKRDKEVVLIANTRQEFEHLYRERFLAIVGNPSTTELFDAANIRNSEYVIICSENDVNNTLITMAAKTAGPRARIISRVSNEASIPKLGIAGAYRMIMPEITAGEEVGEELAKRFTG